MQNEWDKQVDKGEVQTDDNSRVEQVHVLEVETEEVQGKEVVVLPHG